MYFSVNLPNYKEFGKISGDKEEISPDDNPRKRGGIVMKGLKKTIALLLTVLLLVLSATAWADGEATLGNNGIVGDKTGTALSKSLIIYKELTGFNPDVSDVNAPNITYNYAITAGEGDITITDKDGVTANTKQGVGTPTITASVSWTSSETIQTSPTGNHTNKKPITISFSGVTFAAAGVYRYIITESLASGFTYATSGVTDGAITTSRYLDVYVRDAQGTETERQIYGYVLFQSVPAHHTANSSTDSDVTAAVKTTGFVADTGTDGSTQLTADSYYTYNVTISKTLVNDSAMSTHQFPFSVTFANSTITQNIDIIGTVTGPATAADVENRSIDNVTVNPQIADGGTAVYTGVPVGTRVTVYETNNVTGTTYKSEGKFTAAETNDTDAAVNVITSNANSNNAIVASTTAGTAATANKTIRFTNTLELISPTGYVARYAPYALILLAGIVMLVIAIKRKGHKEED